jgi:beta-lactamase superfamily II metal-dependent hydrolase
MKIRTVDIELLRAGPRHNQLLSPLTQYLAVCGNAPAATVALPFEHHEFEQRMAELSYEVASSDHEHLFETLNRTGREMARLLAQIEGLPRALNPEAERSDTLIQLRIVFSASELAMLPFELSKSLTDDGSSTVWLALQARNPVSITRRIRSVSGEGMRWPTRPRILFIAGSETPASEHREALERALAPWRDRDGSTVDRLIVLEHPTFDKISRAVRDAAEQGNPFTHAHVLAHGARFDDDDRYSPIGVALDDEVVSGGRLAGALTSVSNAGIVRPAVVTLATCDSARQSDVVRIDASVAHDLHDQGIALVVASQFPLSIDGSVPFVEIFYDGQLWGVHPLVSLYEVRMRLYGKLGRETHDWAALVIYEALPSDFAAQLDDLRYWQVRRALDCALTRAEALVADGDSDLESRYSEQANRVGAVVARLPTEGPYTIECVGLRAAAAKRLGLVAFQLALSPGAAEPSRERLLRECSNWLSESLAVYRRATKSMLKPTSEPVRRMTNLHWVLGQVLSLELIAGKPFDPARWQVARFAAEVDTESADDVERAWAYVSITELALIRLTEKKLALDQRAGFVNEAIASANRIVDLVGRNSEHTMTTSRQLERYVQWWGDPQLEWATSRLGMPDRQHWHDEHGLVPTVKRVLEVLRGPREPMRELASGSPTGRVAAANSVSTTAETCNVTQKTAKRRNTTAAARQTTTKSTTLFTVEMLPAGTGDCLLIEYGDVGKPRRILVDCGAESTAQSLASRFANQEFELFVLTHIDADHISGALTLLADQHSNIRFGDIWFNGWGQVNRFLSVKQGEQFTELLETRALPWNRAFDSTGARHPAPIVITAGKLLPSCTLAGGMKLTLLSPGGDQLRSLGAKWAQTLLELEPKKRMLARKAPEPVLDLAAFDVEKLARTPERKDRSVANGSSIALLAEFDGREVLLAGDAHADVLVASIKALQEERCRAGERLKLDAFKLAHHGSANATTSALLKMIDCGNYLVSSNGRMFYHPDREAIARVIVDGGQRPTLWFNYRSDSNVLWSEPILRKRYGYVAAYPNEGEEGLWISV